MVRGVLGSVGLCVAALLCNVRADDGFSLHERVDSARAIETNVRFSGRGSRPLPDDRSRSATETKTGAPAADYPFEFASRLEWVERQFAENGADPALRGVRRIRDAQAGIEFFRARGQRLTTTLRSDLALLVARREGDRVIVASAGGPLARDELDLVKTPADPLALGALLPSSAVKIGDTWDLRPLVARTWSEYDALASSSLKATLTACDADRATISVAGDIKGRVLGADGSMALVGEAVFDRKQEMVTRLTLTRTEGRAAGPIEPALNVKSEFVVERKPIGVPPELADSTIRDLPLDLTPQRLLLRLEAPSGAYSLLHDRDWHLCEDDQTRVVLKRLDAAGVTIAQCNLMAGPPAGRGRHQDTAQFQADVRKAIGEKFGQFVGSGEIGDDPALGFRYKLAVEGVELGQGVVPLWYYYLVASPAGEQVIAIFTLSRGTEAAFGDQDLRLMGTLQWNGNVPGRPAAR